MLPTGEYRLQSRAVTNDLSGSHSPPSTRTATSRDIVTHTADEYSRQLSDEGFDPAMVKSKGRQIPYLPDNSHSSARAEAAVSGANFVSGAIGGAGVNVGGMQTDKSSHVHISSASALTSSVSGDRYAMNRLESSGDKGGMGKNSSRISREKALESGGKVRGKGEGGASKLAESVQPKQERDPDRRKDGFSVDSIHNQRSPEDAMRDYEEQLAYLKEQLAKVTEEKDSLLQDRERVSAQWEGKVRRLKLKLKQQKGEGEGEVRTCMHIHLQIYFSKPSGSWIYFSKPLRLLCVCVCVKSFVLFLSLCTYICIHVHPCTV